MASDTPPRIFVGIPSYRDPGAFQYVLDGHKLFYAGLSGSPSISDGITECQYTVKDLFEKAQCPDRVFVGICWQFDPEEDKEVESHHHYAIMHDNSNLILVLLGANETEPGPRGTSSLHRSEVRSFSLSLVCVRLSLSLFCFYLFLCHLFMSVETLLPYSPLSLTHGRGPCWARAQVQALWRGEEYVLSIDSHMRCASFRSFYLSHFSFSF
jgi:hypothetical protein